MCGHEVDRGPTGGGQGVDWLYGGPNWPHLQSAVPWARIPTRVRLISAVSPPDANPIKRAVSWYGCLFEFLLMHVPRGLHDFWLVFLIIFDIVDIYAIF